MSRIREAAVLGGFLLLSFIFGGWVLGSQIKALKLGDRYVTVKGLSERTVKSDLALWSLNLSATGDDYGSVLRSLDDQKAKTVAFLLKQGVINSEISVDAPNVTDKQAREYVENEKGPRYLASLSIGVNSPRVDQISSVAGHVGDLLQQGVILGSNHLQYKFSSLNSIKPDMISDATRSARNAAERFASDSGSRVGSIRQATQGQFSIAAQNDTGFTDPSSPDVPDAGDSSIMKKVRVVTSVDYYLDK